MKHIYYFDTKASRDAAELVRPFVIYTKETKKLEIEDEYPITTKTNPELMAVCYAQGWAANEGFMTEDECNAVTNAMLAGSVVNNTSAFTQVKEFTELVYFKNISAIPAYCFYNCTLLTNIILPDTITAIDAHAFDGCTGLNDKEIKMPSNLVSIGNDAFNSVALYKIVLPATCNTIGTNSFKNAVRIDLTQTTLVILPANTFSGETTWIKLPSTLVRVSTGNNYQSGRSATKSRKGWMWLDATTPYVGGNYCHNIGSGGTIRIYVPDDYVDSYKTSTVMLSPNTKWSAKASLIYPQSQWESDVENGYINV